MTDYQYNIDNIIDGSSVDGENSFFTYVVDPNPINNVSVSPEDLFTFVRLRAFPRNRSIITSDNVYSSNSQDKDGIYFITSTKQNEKGYATTNYTNIGGLENNIEGFGIKEISIDVAMLTPPIVEITFVDVRGGAVFNNYEDYDDDGVRYNKSKFNSFFRLPAPIFELTVKGFYGKAVTYYLNLQKFEANVDTSSGDFIIKCKFLGYQFAFLSDMITNYVIALNNGKVGQKLLSEYIKKDGIQGLLSIPQLLQKYTEVAKYVEDFKKEDVEYELLKIINALQDKIQILQSTIGLSVKTNNDLVYGFNINYENLSDNFGYLFLRDIALYGERLDGDMKNLEKYCNSLIEDINKIIDTHKSKYPVLNDLKVDTFLFSKSKSYNVITEDLINDIRSEIILKETLTIDNFNINFINSKLVNVLPVYYTSFYEIRESVQLQLKKIKDLKFKYEEEIVNKLNKSFTEKIGFNPTVFNVFEIIFGNLDVYLDILYEICKKADLLGEIRVGDMKNYFANGVSGGYTDVLEADKRIYPFPAVYNLKGEYEWLGDIVGENNPNFPELELVNGIISGLVSDNNYENTITKTTTYSDESVYKWIPINVVDVISNGLSSANNFDYGDIELTNLFSTLLKRANILYNHSRINESKFLNFASLEATYFASNILNPNIKNFLESISKEDFVNKGINYFNNNVISEEYSDYNFSESSLFFFLEDELNLENSKYNFGILPLLPNLNKYIANKKTSVDSLLFDGITNFKYDPSYVLNYDLTLCYQDKWTENVILSEYKLLYGSTNRKVNIPYLSVIKNIKWLDGENGGAFSNDRDKANFYKNNKHFRIGISKSDFYNNQPIFDLFYYIDNNIYAKAFFFLNSLNFKGHQFLIDGLKTTSSYVYVNDLYCAYVGALFYRAQEKQNGYDFIVDDIKNNSEFINVSGDNLFNDFSIIDISQYSTDFVNFFIDYFLKFTNNVYQAGVDSGLEFKVKTYVDLGTAVYLNSLSEGQYKESWDYIFSRLIKIKSLANLSPKKIWNDVIQGQQYPNLTSPEKYLTIFYNTMKSSLTTLNVNDFTLGDDVTGGILKDKNIKIQIYNHLKVIYDRWLSYGTTDGKIYNFASYLRGENTTKKLIDHCYFIDRTWSDIGNTAVLNPKPILSYVNEVDGNIYSFMSRILKDNNFNIYNIPSYVNYYNKQDVANMFKPYTFIENNEGGACLIFQYIAGNSRILDLNERIGYANDGFDLKSNNFINIPKSLKERKIPPFILNKTSQLNTDDLKDYLAKYNLSVFRVAYADQNQNMFKEISVSQEDHRETQESILLLNEIAGGKGGTKRLYMGMDLYNMYALRSYKTTVTSMGNMQIFPSQYFQLDNIPLFHGVHIITNVRHNIEPHNITTTFSGRRISKFAYPVIDKMTSYLNLELNEKINAPQLLTTPLESGALINGTDYSEINTEELSNLGYSADLIKTVTENANSPSNPLPTDNVLFTVTKNTTVAKFVLDSNVNTFILNQKLNEIFKQNPADVPTYGVSKGLCASWVKKVLLNLGVVKIGNASTDAWNWFMGLPENQNWLYFNRLQKYIGWEFEEFVNLGVKNGSLLFGYYNGSNYKSYAYNKMQEFTNNQGRIKLITDNVRISGDFNFTPITHIGIFYNNLFYEFVNGKVTLSPHTSFVPVASYEFLSTLKSLAARND